MRLAPALLAAALLALPAAAQPILQTPAEALAQDAGEYARAHGVGLDEAIGRLRAQEASVPETDRIAALYRDRLAGISIEHAPRYRIVVLLTGDARAVAEVVAAEVGIETVHAEVTPQDKLDVVERLRAEGRVVAADDAPEPDPDVLAQRDVAGDDGVRRDEGAALDRMEQAALREEGHRRALEVRQKPKVPPAACARRNPAVSVWFV